MRFFCYKNKLDIAVAVISVILICLLGALLAEFFIEHGGNVGWVNVGMILLSSLLSIPVLAVLPFWIILLTKKEKSLFSVLSFIIVLVLFFICAVIGWVYPE